MHAISVSQLFVYPVKSLRGIAVAELNLNQSGTAFDRQWMVVTPKGKFLTQRVLPKMCLIGTQIKSANLTLHDLTQKQTGRNSIAVPRGGGTLTNVTVWRDSVSAEDCGDEVASWLSDVLGKECRIVFMPKGEEREAPEGDYEFTSQLGFADAYPLLMASESSLAEFNTHLSNKITMQRFRPNIVIKGSTAFAEDQWGQVKIGQQVYVLTSPCTRCAVPAIDPATGERQSAVLDALNEHRRFGTETRFGQNVVYQDASTIKIGDSVELIT